MVEIMQGDQFMMPLHIKSDDGIINNEDIEEIRLFIGHIVKTIGDGIEYDDDLETWLVKFSQQETLSLPAGKNRVQIRVKFNSGEVIGQSMDAINVLFSKDKAVM